MRGSDTTPPGGSPADGAPLSASSTPFQPKAGIESPPTRGTTAPSRARCSEERLGPPLLGPPLLRSHALSPNAVKDTALLLPPSRASPSALRTPHACCTWRTTCTAAAGTSDPASHASARRTRRTDADGAAASRGERDAEAPPPRTGGVRGEMVAGRRPPGDSAGGVSGARAASSASEGWLLATALAPALLEEANAPAAAHALNKPSAHGNRTRPAATRFDGHTRPTCKGVPSGAHTATASSGSSEHAARSEGHASTRHASADGGTGPVSPLAPSIGPERELNCTSTTSCKLAIHFH